MEAELLYPKSAPLRICKGAETDSRAKFGKEAVARSRRRPKWVLHYGAQDAQDAQALLRLRLPYWANPVPIQAVYTI